MEAVEMHEVIRERRAAVALSQAKGTPYLLIHQYGHQIRGRWTGLSVEGAFCPGWAVFARTETGSADLLMRLIEGRP